VTDPATRKDPHFTALENMYRAAPVNRYYRPTITIGEGQAEIEIAVREDFFHSGGAVHGSVYFKMLDDAAFFAANSLEREVFVLTNTFTTYLTRPVTDGIIRSVGTVVHRTRSQFLAESIAYNGEGKEIGRGNGLFVRSRNPLTQALGYGGGA
jgi:uncharacterized protein (TIGR00369 family)